ncbi:protogenin A-like [Schistocerca serialis cubense]|uniref:protogenin A-like n=1 Tax=Schistocerca serialis cubense TaxID=2023355 RepID=UPI00214E295E|nr:protogenin A-like [Schistocerca serialis cubense]
MASKRKKLVVSMEEKLKAIKRIDNSKFENETMIGEASASAAGAAPAAGGVAVGAASASSGAGAAPAGAALRAWASRRRPLTLGCPRAAPTAPVVGWLLHDRPLALRDDGRRSLLADGSLHIAKVQPKADLGEYRCMLRTPEGLVASPAIALELAGISHEFSAVPENVTATAGEVVRFTCQIQSVPSATIAWEHNKKQLPQNSRYVTVDPGVLYITSVESSDEGNYRCVATNPATGKKRPSPEARLSVQRRPAGAAPAAAAAPARLLPPLAAVVNATEGGAATLVCAASGVPPPALRWLHPDGAAGAVGAGLVALELSNVTAASAGEYTCATEDGEQEQKVTLSVWQAPEVRVKPPSQSFPAAKTVRFNCEAVGEPKPEIVWFKDGVRLHINGRMKQRGAELLIATTQMSDSGLYQCAARNAAGENYAVARLSIKSPSRIDPPRGLSCRTLSSGGIELSWNQPPGGNFTAFTVHYLPTEGGEETQLVTVNQSIRVEDLQPFTNYTLYTRVYFQRSASEESERVICRTAEGVPTTAPRVSVQTVDATTASVSWQPLTPVEARGHVASYKLQWGPQGEPAYSVEELPPSTTHYVLTGLEPGRHYNVRVLAATSRGYPTEDLPWVTVQMPSGSVDGDEGPGGGVGGSPVAVALVVTRVNATVLQVAWKKPNTSVDDGVQLWYRPRGSSEVGPFTYDANATRAVLTGLVEGPLYEIRVRSGGVAGFAVSVPSLPPPLDVSATPTSPRSLRIAWTASPDVARYSVAVIPLGIPGGAEGKQRHFLVSTPPAIEVTELEPNTLYEVKIRSEDSAGRKGPYGQTMEVRTPEDIPSHVRDVRTEALNRTAVRVTWRPPAVLNGVLVGYTVAVDPNRTAALPGKAVRAASVSAVKHSADVSGLQPNVQYFVTVSARNGAGHGPPSGAKAVVIRVAGNESREVTPIPTVLPPPPGDQPPVVYDDQHLGIAIGVSVGLACVVVCVAAFLWRRHCPKVRGGRHRRGRVPGLAGCGGGPEGGGRGAAGRYARPQQRQWELEVLDAAPPLAESHIPPPPPPELFDTKGGYPNGHTNGVKRPVLSNGRIPNGHTSTGIHITENPQYKCGDKGGASLGNEGLQAGAGASAVAGVGEREQLLVQHGSATGDSVAADTSAEGSVVDTTQVTLLGSDMASTTSE